MCQRLPCLCALASILLAAWVVFLTELAWWAKLLVAVAILFASLFAAAQYVQPPPSDTLERDSTAPFHPDSDYIRRAWFVPPPGLSLEGKVALVTGGSSGIGRGVADELCRLGATVIITARSEARAKSVADDIMKGSPGRGSVKAMALELSSLADVRRFASAFLSEHPKLNFLVENAGILTPLEAPFVSDDGFEMVYATNYLGHFLLLNLLLPALKAADGDVRITATSSIVHWHHTTDLEQLLPTSKSATTSISGLGIIDKFRQYGNTKLLQVLMCFELQRRLHDEGVHITVTPLSPGLVATAIITEERGQDLTPNCIMLKPHEGAQTTIYALLAPDMQGEKGFFLQPYYTPKHRQPPLLGGLFGVITPFEFLGQKCSFGLHKWIPHPDAHRRAFATTLWEASAEAVGLRA